MKKLYRYVYAAKGFFWIKSAHTELDHGFFCRNSRQWVFSCIITRIIRDMYCYVTNYPSLIPIILCVRSLVRQLRFRLYRKCINFNVPIFENLYIDFIIYQCNNISELLIFNFRWMWSNNIFDSLWRLCEYCNMRLIKLYFHKFSVRFGENWIFADKVSPSIFSECDIKQSHQSISPKLNSIQFKRKARTFFVTCPSAYRWGFLHAYIRVFLVFYYSFVCY